MPTASPRSSFFRPLLAGVAFLPFLAACGGDSAPEPGPTPVPPVPKLVDLADCPGDKELACGFLEVPLDAADPQSPTLRLSMIMQRNDDAPRGVAVWLPGGPGGSVRGMLMAFRDRMSPELVSAYQWVGLDPRGSGMTALDCPELQEAVGFSDLLPAPESAIVDCADIIGDDRRFLATSTHVADLDLFRQALGQDSWTLNGISYGTYTGSVYANTYPDRVRRLVLDSPVPHTGLDPFIRPLFESVPAVLDALCEDQDCPANLPDVLAAVVAQEEDPVEVLDMLVSQTVLNELDPRVPVALQATLAGDRSLLSELLQEARDGSRADDLRDFSTGLHHATLCQDMLAPWGDSSTPIADRQPALDAALAELDDAELWPFNRATVLRNQLIHDCMAWPPTPAGTQRRDGLLPDVPVLVLGGGLDMSTPVSEAYRQIELAPDGRLVVIEDSGHSVQNTPAGRANVANFLCGEPEAYPVPEGWQPATC